MVSVLARPLDRRQLAQLGIGGAMLGLVGAEHARAACGGSAMKLPDVATTPAPSFTCDYWIDGLQFGARSNLASRATLAVFLQKLQQADSFISAVALCDAAGELLGVRTFDASEKLVSGHVPYVIFENVALDHTKTYHVVCVQKTSEMAPPTVYKFDIVEPKVSRFPVDRLPSTAELRVKTLNFIVGNFAHPTPGLLTTPYQFFTKNGLSAHSVDGHFKALGTDGSFTLNLKLMHADASTSHFSRYFIVTDPVGRYLGIAKRAHNDPGGSGVGVDVSRLDNATQAAFEIPANQVADVRDCPYVQVFVEDDYDAFARSVIRLR